MRRILGTVLLACGCASWAWGQDCVAWAWDQDVPPTPAETISLTVPAGTTLQVALDKEVRVKKVGQPLHGLLVEPLYAFDREVIPVGSKVAGRITEIEGVSGKRRFLAALDADFTPARKVQVEFDEIILSDGKRIPMKTVVTPGSGRPLQLITTVDREKKKTVQDAARAKMKEAIREAKRKWHSAMKQIKEPGKMHRLGRYAVAQLPAHPQYIDAGTVYFAELQEPLDLGSTPLTPEAVTSMATTPPPCNLLAHAQLLTPVDSATTQKDTPVEAVLAQPAFSGDRLVFPQGTLLKGSVLQVQPARRLGRNGKLRIVFNQLVLPDGIQQKVDANLEGVQASQEQNVRLDLEGGARSAPAKKRYASTGIAVALAVASYQDRDFEDGVTSTNGGTSQAVAGGAIAFKLIGIAAALGVRSRALSFGMGLYGAGLSAYSNFLAPGREVAFPKGTAMEIGFWFAENCEASTQPE